MAILLLLKPSFIEVLSLVCDDLNVTAN